MKNTFVILTAALSLSGIAAIAAEIKSAADLKDARSKASYGLGVQAGNTWKNRGADVDWDAYIRGLMDASGGSGPLLTDAEIREAMTQFQKDTQARYQAKLAEDGAKNKEAGDKFLEANKSKDGVKTTPSGLQYKVISMTEGAKPTAADKVTVHYTGTLIDGKKFDSSLDRGQPATFPLNGVIKGWTEGLQLMPTGSKYQLFIPPDLAYGLNAPASIGPNQVLVFDVELLSIESAAPPPPVTSDIIKVPSQEELAKGAKIEVIKAEDAKKLAEQEKAKK
ncbi:MAG: FKBP-type peptidyl-prolyl cis-trans isomerase [Limisphaerales bacterium]